VKLYINRKPIFSPWGGGALFVNALYEHLPKLGIQVDSKMRNSNVALIAGLEGEDQLPSAMEMMLQSIVPKALLRVNDNDARKNTNHVDGEVVYLSNCVNMTVFVSEWQRDYFLDKGCDRKNCTVIVNGVNKNIFTPNDKLDNGKINIVAHHWSNNRLKGFDVYEWIDEFVGLNSDKYSFTYIGRELGTFKHTNVIAPLYGKQLGDELGRYDIYISGTRWDPGPNHLIESISCGLPSYAFCDGGGAAEFVGKDHVFSSIDELKNLLLAKDFKRNSTSFDSWEQMAQKYADLIKSL
jgi:glycosyltransferase involved in cell wall biosynthesis